MLKLHNLTPQRRHELRLIALIVILCTALWISTDSFFTVRNAFDLLTSNAVIGVLAAGLLVVLIAGGIDISMTATASVAQYVAISLTNSYGGNWLTLFALACSIGVLCGILNAIFIRGFSIRSIIVTIATLNIFWGLLMFFSHGNYIYVLPDWFSFGLNWIEYTDAEGNFFTLNLQIVALISVFTLTWFILNHTSLGRQVYALGGNADAAARLGFNIFGLHLFVYGYMGFVAGIASLLQAQLAQSVVPTAMVGRELDVLAAVVLGGASLLGGVGSVFGTILGLALLAIMQNGLLLLGISSYWSQFFVGLVIIASVSAAGLSHLRERKEAKLRHG